MCTDRIIETSLGSGSCSLQRCEFFCGAATDIHSTCIAQLLRNFFELLTNLGGFTFELGDNPRVHHLAALTFDRATALCYDLHKAAGATAQILDSGEFVVDGAVSARSQLRFV